MKIAKFATLCPERGSTVRIVSGVSYYDLSTSGLVMTTPNEKFEAAIQVLCGVLGITEIEYFSRFVRSSSVDYYRVKGESNFYTKGDFTVVLAERVSKRLEAGQTLK